MGRNNQSPSWHVMCSGPRPNAASELILLASEMEKQKRTRESSSCDAGHHRVICLAKHTAHPLQTAAFGNAPFYCSFF